MVMRNGKPDSGSGKSHFNRIKKPGESWVKLRDEARRNNTLNERGYVTENQQKDTPEMIKQQDTEFGD